MKCWPKSNSNPNITERLSGISYLLYTKNVTPETLEEDSVQFGLGKVQRMNDFKLNEFKSSIDRKCFDHM